MPGTIEITTEGVQFLRVAAMIDLITTIEEMIVAIISRLGPIWDNHKEVILIEVVTITIGSHMAEDEVIAGTKTTAAEVETTMETSRMTTDEATITHEAMEDKEAAEIAITTAAWT